MAQVINTNTKSLNAQRNLNTSGNNLATSIQRLSSGLRINSAKDDAAGLAISERFSTQIRGMNQAARNANDAISLAQTAEGALSEIGNNLQRIRELAVQSRNATNSTSDRDALNAEVQLLKAEIQRVAEQTNFNGTKLLDGKFQSQSFQIGADQGQTIDIAQIANANINALGYWNQASTAASVTSAAATTTVASASASGVALTGVTTGAGPGAVTPATHGKATIAAAGFVGASGPLQFTINGTGGGNPTVVTVAASQATANNVLSAINTALTAGNSGVTVALDGGNLVFTDGGAAGATSAVTVSAATGTLTGGATLTAGSFTAAAGTAQSTGAPNPGTTTFGTLAAGALTINGVSITTTTSATSATQGADAIAAAIRTAAGLPANAAALGGVTASSNNGVLMLTSAQGVKVIVGGTDPAAAGLSAGLMVDAPKATFNAASFSLTGTKGAATIDVVVAGSAAQRASQLVAAVNKQSYNTGVNASLDGDKVKLSSATGNFSIGRPTPNAGATPPQTQAQADAAFLAATGLVAGATTTNYVQGEAVVGFAKTDISTAVGADNAILAMDAALTSVTSARADLGAIQNRFTSTVANLNTSAENLTAARSRIRDTDYASETAELTRTQILQQAGTAMLAQANQTSQNVLSLLR